MWFDCDECYENLRRLRRKTMDKELVTKWVEALELGRYEQGKDKLRSADNKFCCLGVLADIQGADWAYSGYGGFVGCVFDEDMYSNGYTKVPNGPPEPFSEHLAELNDTGTTFKEIAEILREEYLE